MRRTYHRYSIYEGVREYPTLLWKLARRSQRITVAFVAIALVICLGISGTLPKAQQRLTGGFTSVPGENYQICNQQSTYLTSPWTYHALSSGQQSLTVDQYHKLNTDGSENATAPGSAYGSTLPVLPSYILSENPSTTAAEIFAPGSTAVSNPSYNFPESPVVYFFEGGNYGLLALASISGDEFIGGSAPGFAEPMFNDGNNAGGIDSGNGSHYFSGGDSTLASTANSGATTVTTTSAISGYIGYVTFADGSTYQLSNASGTTLTLSSPLTATESSGSQVWANVEGPLVEASAPATQGATSLTLGSSSIPFVQYSSVVINGESYTLSSVSGSQTGYTIGIQQGLDMAVAAHTPVYYNAPAGDVTVSYLDIANDSHNTTGTIYTGTGWTITHNNIHDGYKDSSGTPTPGDGVAIYGGDEGTIEYNCMSKMGDYGVNAFGTNNTFDYNEVYESNYEPDPGCGCSGGGKWWGTLNADIVDNAFVNDSPGGGGPIWLDNGNSGTLIQGNYFNTSYGAAIASETGFNLDVTGNLFLDGGWGDGTGACGGDNCDGAVNINSSGGFNVPGSRYENQINIANNQFINNWMGIDIWQSGGRSCQNSGEGWPADAPYCSGGFPNTNTTAAVSKYGGANQFSHAQDSTYGGMPTVAQTTSSGSSTVLLTGSEATGDQIGFLNPSTTTTANTTDVSTFTGTGTITVGSTNGFPGSGQLYAATSTGWAILSYTGTTGTTFTGVSLVNDPQQSSSGTLTGVIDVQEPAYTTTTSTTNVTSLTGSQTISAPTVGFPSSGELRVGTSDAWSDGDGSFTGAILSYTGKTGTTFTGVSLVKAGSNSLGSGTLTGPVRQVEPYKVTGETCYANDCAVSITPSLGSSAAIGTSVTSAGTCQLFATAAALPAGPLAPDGTSYWDACQWEAKDIAVSGNTFSNQPSQMNASTSLTGGSVSCTLANNCGLNFMADQYNAGELPFNTEIGSNALMSSSSFTGCPTWDSGCTSDPLANLNALNPPPGAVTGNGEAPGNNVWSSNTLDGPWSFVADIFGNCGGGGVYMPTDPTTGKGLTASACNVTFPQWQADWQQDSGSTYDPMAVSMYGLTAGQEIHGTQAVSAYEDTQSPLTIGSTLKVNGTSAATLNGAPFNFSLNTLNYHDGSYTLQVSGTDSGGNTGNDSLAVNIANGDLNSDGNVNISDLAIMAGHWGQTDSNYADGNITGQGTINISDLAVMANNWGSTGL